MGGPCIESEHGLKIIRWEKMAKAQGNHDMFENEKGKMQVNPNRHPEHYGGHGTCHCPECDRRW